MFKYLKLFSLCLISVFSTSGCSNTFNRSQISQSQNNELSLVDKQRNNKLNSITQLEIDTWYSFNEGNNLVNDSLIASYPTRVYIENFSFELGNVDLNLSYYDSYKLEIYKYSNNQEYVVLSTTKTGVNANLNYNILTGGSSLFQGNLFKFTDISNITFTNSNLETWFLSNLNVAVAPTPPTPTPSDNIYGVINDWFNDYVFVNSDLDEITKTINGKSLTMNQWLSHIGTITILVLLVGFLISCVVWLFKFFGGLIKW